jgi:hypothetical protein
VPFRRLLTILVFTLPLWPAAATIVFVGSFVAEAAGDKGGAYFLRWVGWVAVMLLVLDLFAVALLLGIRALRDDDRDRPRPP